MVSIPSGSFDFAALRSGWRGCVGWLEIDKAVAGVIVIGWATCAIDVRATSAATLVCILGVHSFVGGDELPTPLFGQVFEVGILGADQV